MDSEITIANGQLMVHDDLFLLRSGIAVIWSSQIASWFLGKEDADGDSIHTVAKDHWSSVKRNGLCYPVVVSAEAVYDALCQICWFVDTGETHVFPWRMLPQRVETLVMWLSLCGKEVFGETPWKSFHRYQKIKEWFEEE